MPRRRPVRSSLMRVAYQLAFGVIVALAAPVVVPTGFPEGWLWRQPPDLPSVTWDTPTSPADAARPASLTGRSEIALRLPLGPEADVRQPRARWAWPVPEPHVVLHGFDPPDVRWGAGHRGVDLAASPGGQVRAPTDGVVSFTGVVAGREVLVVAHADGLRSTFEPVLASRPVGAAVTKGDVIGSVTASPGHCAPVTCVHWGVLRGASYLDPLEFVRQPVVLLPLR